MIEVKYRFEDLNYKYKMYITYDRIVGDIIQAEDPLRYIIWDCEILEINDKEILLRKIRPNELWYKMVSEVRG